MSHVPNPPTEPESEDPVNPESDSASLPMEGEEVKCLWCSGAVQGEVEFIPLTISCAKCYKKRRAGCVDVFKGSQVISMEDAVSLYGCVDEDLEKLPHQTMQIPCHGSSLSIKLYPKVRAWCLGYKRRARERRERATERAEREEQLRKERIDKLRKKRRLIEKQLRTDLKKMDRVILRFLLGDYLSKLRGTRTKGIDVKACYAALGRVKEILKACPRAHPGAVFDFCVAHPHGGPTEFAELRDKIRRVFQLEGDRIFRLSGIRSEGVWAVKSSLEKTPLKADFDEHLQTSRSIVRSHLVRLADAETADKIMKRASLIDTELTDLSEERVAQKLYEIWTWESKRSQKHEKALKSENLRFASRDHIVSRCMGGQFSVQQAVALVRERCARKQEEHSNLGSDHV